jgi:hypothetical protein
MFTVMYGWRNDAKALNELSFADRNSAKEFMESFIAKWGVTRVVVYFIDETEYPQCEICHEPGCDGHFGCIKCDQDSHGEICDECAEDIMTDMAADEEARKERQAILDEQ